MPFGTKENPYIIKTQQLTSKAHAILGPSSADRWWECSGSPQFLKRVKTPASTYAAAEGTVAHHIVSVYLDALADDSPRAFEYMPENWVGTWVLEDGHLIEVEKDWIEPLNIYINFCLEESANLDNRHIFTEYRVPLIGGADYDGLEREGTADRVHVHPFKKIHVIDLKFGKGKLVKAFNNLQLQDYMLGVWRSLPPALTEDITWLEATIVQPRHWQAGEGIDTWRFHVSDLIKFEAEVPKRVAATKDPDAQLKAGDWCDNSFCAGRLECPAYIAYTNSAATTKLADLVSKIDLPVLADKSRTISADSKSGKVVGLPDPLSLTPEQRALVLDRAASLKTWIGLVEKAVEDDCKRDDVLHARYQELGYQLEEGLGNRKWRAETLPELVVTLVEADQDVEEVLWKTKEAVSPTELERRIGKNTSLNKLIQEKFVVREPTGMKLKPAKDPSKAVRIEDKFKGVVIDVPAKMS